MSLAGPLRRDVAPGLVLPIGPQILGLVFDLDGTLYLNGPIRRTMFWRLLRAAAAHPLSTWRESRLVYNYRRAQEYLREFPQPSAAAQMRLACAWTGVPLEQAVGVIARWMEDAPMDLLARNARPCIVDLLEAATKKGIRLGLISDYPAGRKLEAMGLDKYFSVVLSSQDDRVGSLKPFPKGLNVVLDELEVEPARAAYIGDRPSVDGETAHRAGVAGIILGKPLNSAGQGWIGVPDVPALRARLEI